MLILRVILYQSTWFEHIVLSAETNLINYCGRLTLHDWKRMTASMNILLHVGKLLKRSQRIYTRIRKIKCYLSTVEPGFLKTSERQKHWFLKEFLQKYISM